MSWFNSWFGTFYYKLLYQYRDEKEARRFLDRLMQYLPVKPGAKIIDVGCGQGRHSFYLSEKGYMVVGLDIMKENIEEASRLANAHLMYVQQDMREQFPVKDADLALNLFTSFGYFQSENENLKVLQNIHHSLHKDGILVLDFLNADKVKNNLVPDEIVHRENVTFRIKRYIRENKVVKEIVVEEKGHVERYFERVELLTVDDFKKYFEAAGFEIATIFGNYKLEAYDRMNSDRLILIASKTNALH